MIDIASLLTLQARSRRNALSAARRLRHARHAAAEAQRAVDDARARSGVPALRSQALGERSPLS